MAKRLPIALVALAMFVLVVVLPVSADSVNGYYLVAPNINQGATIFLGEQGLNIQPALEQANAAGVPSNYSTIGWWASAADIQTTAPTVSVDTTARAATFYVDQTEFDGYEGQWYLVASDQNQRAKPGAGAVFNVKAPLQTLKILDLGQNNGADVSGKSVPIGSRLQFQIENNLYTALDPTLRYPVSTTVIDNKIQSGYCNIVVMPKDQSGAIIIYLLGEIPYVFHTVGSLNVATTPYVWGSPDSVPGANTTFWWNTAALTPGTDTPAYPAGTYTVFVQSWLNNMENNYLNGTQVYWGRTRSEPTTITLVSDTVSITANKDSVVRSKPFSVTITGKPSGYYNLWVRDTNTMNLNEYDNGPVIVTPFQDKVFPGDPITDAYLYQNGGGIANVTSNAYGDGTNYAYARVQLSTSGTRTVEFTTTSNTKAQKYTIRVESNNFGLGLGNTTVAYLNGDFKGDEVDVKVEKGAVTIVEAGDQSYYLGEEIKLSGTNTESYNTFLFIIGPNLPTNGGVLTNPKVPVTIGTAWNSVVADVLADNTWSYKWGTANLDLDAGTYTIYAVSKPYDKNSDLLARAAYGTVSLIIKKPFVSATASQSTVAQGDRIYIIGTADGQPNSVAIWILGKNFAFRQTETVNSDGTFKYEVKQDTTKSLYSGQYFVVVQHPMMNGVYDIDICSNQQYVCDFAVGQPYGGPSGITGPVSVFKLTGPGSLQGSDAADALVTAINQPYIDDTYTKLQFLIEQPVITIVPIGDKHIGDKFTITAATNLAADDEILVQVYSSSFKPTQKSQSGEFSGATGTVKVQKGDSGMNTILFEVDSSTFKPDEYIVTEDAVIQEATGTALFNVLEDLPPTAAPTPGATPVPTAATKVPTTVPPTATPTSTKSPGYGALIALIGLGAVAFIIVHRH